MTIRENRNSGVEPHTGDQEPTTGSSRQVVQYSAAVRHGVTVVDTGYCSSQHIEFWQLVLAKQEKKQVV